MRRIRKSSALREMLAETTLSKADLIQPIFIKEDLKGREAIKSMPGINRLGLDVLNDEIKNKMNTYYQKDLIDLGYEKN